MARCQRGKLDAPTEKKRVCTNYERADAISDECREGSFDFFFVASMNDFDLYPDSRGSRRHVSRHGRCVLSIFRIHESGNASCLRHQFEQQSEAFGTQAKFSEVK